MGAGTSGTTRPSRHIRLHAYIGRQPAPLARPVPARHPTAQDRPRHGYRPGGRQTAPHHRFCVQQVQRHYRGDGCGSRRRTYIQVHLFLPGVHETFPQALDLLAHGRSHPQRALRTERGNGIRQPLPCRRLPSKGGLAGGHQREPGPCDSLRHVQPVARTGADPDTRHDMRPLQGKSGVRADRLLATLRDPQKRGRFQAVSSCGEYPGENGGRQALRPDHHRFDGDDYENGAQTGFSGSSLAV